MRAASRAASSSATFVVILVLAVRAALSLVAYFDLCAPERVGALPVVTEAAHWFGGMR